MVKCKKCRDGMPHSFKHGSSGYCYHNCRCDICRQWAINHKRTWRQNNPELLAAQVVRANQKHGPGYRARLLRDWRRRNLARARTTDAAWRWANIEKVREYDRNWKRAHSAKQREYVQQNRDRVNERARDWVDRNRDRIRQQNQARVEANRDYYRARAAEAHVARSFGIPAPKNGQPWEIGEDAIVQRSDISITEICYLLGRSYGAVRSRRVRLNNNQHKMEGEME